MNTDVIFHRKQFCVSLQIWHDSHIIENNVYGISDVLQSHLLILIHVLRGHIRNVDFVTYNGVDKYRIIEYDNFLQLQVQMQSGQPQPSESMMDSSTMSNHLQNDDIDADLTTLEESLDSTVISAGDITSIPELSGPVRYFK